MADGKDLSRVDEPPPILGNWRNVYAFVLGFLALVIVALVALTRAYAP